MKTIPYLLYVLIDGHFRVRGALDVSHFSLGASSNQGKSVLRLFLCRGSPRVL